MRSKATSDMKILSAEDRRRRFNKSLPFLRDEATFIFPFRSWSLHFNLIQHCSNFLLIAALLHNANLIFWALISLPMALPLLAASSDNKLDLCLGLEECTGDAPCITRQVTLHRFVLYGMWWHHMQYFCSEGWVYAWSCMCACTSEMPPPPITHRQAASLILFMIHTLIPHDKPNDHTLTVYYRFTLKSRQSHSNESFSHLISHKAF